MAAEAHRRYKEIMRDVEGMIDDHSELPVCCRYLKSLQEIQNLASVRNRQVTSIHLVVQFMLGTNLHS
jgi:hypothetical protein